MVIPLFEKEGQGEIFRTTAADASEQIPLSPPEAVKIQIPLKSPFFKGGCLEERKVQLFIVSTRESRSFESEFPSLEKRGQGRFVEFARDLFNFFTGSVC
jgi:hypothetical protein